MNSYEKLEGRFQQVQRLNDIRAIASWDEAVMMPVGASAYRNEALAELGFVIQNLVGSPDVGDWIAETVASQNKLNDWQRSNLREMRRIYTENTAVPAELNQRLTVARMNCEQQWRKLRAENNWSAFLPHLQEVLNLTRQSLRELQKANGLSIYDTALSLFSPGLSTTVVENCLVN